MKWEGSCRGSVGDKMKINDSTGKMLFFFFKQKTAYEIGTGEWSSDVCSSDLSCALLVLWTS